MHKFLIWILIFNLIKRRFPLEFGLFNISCMWIYPTISKLSIINYLLQTGIGLLLAAASMIVAAVVEIERKKHFGFSQKVGDEVFYSSNLTIFIQIPQFALVGASEAFTSISGLWVNFCLCYFLSFYELKYFSLWFLLNTSVFKSHVPVTKAKQRKCHC